MINLKPCPWRVHGIKRKSLTVEGEEFYNETFMPCMGDKCACYEEYGDEARCMREHQFFILGVRGEQDDVR